MNNTDLPVAPVSAPGAPVPVVQRRRSKGLSDKHLKILLLLPAIVLVGATAIGPLFSGLYLAFRDWNLSKSAASKPLWTLAGDGWQNIAYLFDNFSRALSDSALQNSIWVTIIFTVLSVVISMGLALGIALLLGRGTRSRILVRTLLILPFAMSPALVGISWRFMVSPQFGLLHAVFKDTWPWLAGIDWLANPVLAFAVLIASDVWHWTPYMAMLLLGGLASVPKETQEAAEIDGASTWQVFRDVTLPALLPVLVVASILKAIFSLKMFDQVFMITSGGPGQATQTLAYFIYVQGFKYYDMSYAAAVSYFLVIPMLALAFIYIRLVFKRA